ncbi:MAG: hypothetical protein AAFQ81_18900, partial [Pseudomonadota bacterium]
RSMGQEGEAQLAMARRTEAAAQSMPAARSEQRSASGEPSMGEEARFRVGPQAHSVRSVYPAVESGGRDVVPEGRSRTRPVPAREPRASEQRRSVPELEPEPVLARVLEPVREQ